MDSIVCVSVIKEIKIQRPISWHTNKLANVDEGSQSPRS